MCLNRVVVALALSLSSASMLAGCARSDGVDQNKSGESAASVDSHAEDHRNHGSAHDSGHESTELMVHTEPAAPSMGQAVVLKMMIHGANGTMVREFEVAHEKLVHLIMVREGLDEFAHEHPAVDDQGNLTLTHTFPKAGKYYLYADYKPKLQAASVARAELEVRGESSPAPALVVNAPGIISADGLAAEVDLQNPRAGEETEIRFRLTDGSGKPVNDLQPYLGARGHLVMLSADSALYVHSHPVGKSSAANEVVFVSHFPAAGVYKGWAQFRQAGQIRTVPFVVQIP
jgi:hypothetical protein